MIVTWEVPVSLPAHARVNRDAELYAEILQFLG